MMKIIPNMSLKFYHNFIPINGYIVSGVSPTAGRGAVSLIDKRNFGNVVSFEILTKK
jgi:hypothetical protein